MRINTKFNFSESDFVSFLLPLLCKNGISEIDENELAKELYYYYTNPQFKELFQDICKTRNGISDKVDISNGLYKEKFWSGSIWWDSIRCTPLHLRYDKDIDLSWVEKYLSEDGKNKMYQLAQEFGIRYAIKKNSANPMNIYGTDPNTTYSLVSAKKYGHDINLELLTDGEISNITLVDLNENTFFASPYSSNEYITYKDPIAIYVDIENATYAISQGKTDDVINYFSVFTYTIDRDKLEEIKQIGNSVYKEEDYSITKEKPYVRKIVLK